MITYIHGVANAQNGNGSFALGQIVPAGQLWVIEAAGIGTDDQAFPRPIDFSLGVGDTEALYPVQVNAAPYSQFGGTPMMALTRRLIIPAGLRLYARENGLQEFHNWYISYYGFSMPMDCLERLLLNSSGTVIPPAEPSPDLTAFRAAVTAAATALNTLATSAP